MQMKLPCGSGKGILNNNKAWTKWLLKQINMSLNTIEDWQNFIALATKRHANSLEDFIKVCGYQVIGPEEHGIYSDQLLEAERILMSAELAAIPFYLLIRVKEDRLLHYLNAKCITILVDERISGEAQAKKVLNQF